MTKLVIIHPRIEDSLLQSFASDVIPVQYNAQLTKEQLLSYGPVSHIAFLYHYPGFERLPFFPDSILSANASDSSLKPTYKYFSNNVIDIIKSLRDANSNGQQFVIDILSCDLNSQRYKDELALIETDLNVDIRYSLDKTGNPSSGANWVLESDNVNIRDLYFTQNILSWNGVLTGDISSAIKAGTYNAFITWNISTKTYTQQDNFDFDDLGVSADSYIELLAGETYNGNGYTINFNGLTDLIGLFATEGNSIDDAPIVKNLGVLNGTLAEFGGFIIRGGQRYFKVINCYSTGTIETNSGGIAGSSSGLLGHCVINNCYTTGPIGLSAGGITGSGAGYVSGMCMISNCYTTGPIGLSAGGITGSAAGLDSGTCIINNCYSTGSINENGGGITGMSAGYMSGTCLIIDCYSTGTISQNGGGICGNNAVNYTVTNCVSNSPTVAGASVIPTNSTELSTLNTVPSAWSSALWASGLAVTVGLSSYTLPILKAFQVSPWLSTTTDSLYYNQATDNAVLFLSSNYTMSAPQPQAITVNLNVNVDASGNIEVFGQEGPTIINKVVASYTMPPACLYEMQDPADNSGSSIFEFWEPSDALGTKKARRAVDKPRYNQLLSYFGFQLAKVLTNSLNAIDADPFNQPKYTSTQQYYTHDTFGRLALSSYAHYLFGHVAATAAITNDTAFMTTMNAYSNTAAADFVYNTSTSYNSDVATNNIAKRIVDKIAKLTDAQVLEIVKQVIGQDASRAMGQDNSSLAPEVRQPLKFYNGDKIYVNVTLQQPTVSVLNNEVAQKGEPEATKFGTDAGDNDGTLNRSYTIEITLNNHVSVVPVGETTLGFDPVTRFGTISLSTGSQYSLAIKDIITGAPNNSQFSIYNSVGGQISGVSSDPARTVNTGTSAMLKTDGTLLGAQFDNSTSYNLFYYLNPIGDIHKKTVQQDGMYMQYGTIYGNPLIGIIPMSSMIKFTMPVYDFTITGWSISGLNRLISFTSSRTIPSGFRLTILKRTTTSFGVAGVSSLTDGTTTVNPSGSPAAIRTNQLVIGPGKTYTFTIGEDFMSGTAGGGAVSNNTYRVVLLHDSHTTGSTTGYVRFGGSYLFGFGASSPQIIEH